MTASLKKILSWKPQPYSVPVHNEVDITKSDLKNILEESLSDSSFYLMNKKLKDWSLCLKKGKYDKGCFLKEAAMRLNPQVLFLFTSQFDLPQQYTPLKQSGLELGCESQIEWLKRFLNNETARLIHYKKVETPSTIEETVSFGENEENSEVIFKQETSSLLFTARVNNKDLFRHFNSTAYEYALSNFCLFKAFLQKIESVHINTTFDKFMAEGCFSLDADIEVKTFYWLMAPQARELSTILEKLKIYDETSALPVLDNFNNWHKILLDKCSEMEGVNDSRWQQLASKKAERINDFTNFVSSYTSSLRIKQEFELETTLALTQNLTTLAFVNYKLQVAKPPLTWFEQSCVIIEPEPQSECDETEDADTPLYTDIVDDSAPDDVTEATTEQHTEQGANHGDEIEEGFIWLEPNKPLPIPSLNQN